MWKREWNILYLTILQKCTRTSVHVKDPQKTYLTTKFDLSLQTYRWLKTLLTMNNLQSWWTGLISRRRQSCSLQAKQSQQKKVELHKSSAVAGMPDTLASTSSSPLLTSVWVQSVPGSSPIYMTKTALFLDQWVHSVLITASSFIFHCCSDVKDTGDISVQILKVFLWLQGDFGYIIWKKWISMKNDRNSIL